MTARMQIVVVLAIAVGCRARGAETPSGESDSAVASDVQVLCTRVQNRSLTMWSQATMMTETVQGLTIRIDQGDEAARCELGRLMLEHAKACRTTARELMRRCS